MVKCSGIDLSGYMVKDAERAMAFYRDILGLEPARIYPENRGCEYDFPDGASFGLSFAVDDLEAAQTFLNERGIPVLWQTQTPNCRMLMIRDTEGNSVFLHKRNV